MNDLMQTIRTSIEASGLSLNALAGKAGIDVGQLSRFMRGQRGLNLTTLSAILNALGLEVRLVKRPKRKVR